MNTVKTFMLLLLLTFLLLGVGMALGGIPGLIMAFIFSMMLNLFAYWKSDKIALTMTRAKAVSEEEDRELHRIVEEEALLARVPKPRVYMIDSDSPNAFATGRNPQHAAVAVTRGIRKLLNREELGGVIAHELAHIGNRDTLIMTMAAAIAGAIAMLAFWAQWSLIFGGMGRGRGGGGQGGYMGLIVMLAIIILMPIAATIVRLAISRSREYQADITGAKTSGKAWALASALEKLERGTQLQPMKVNDGVSHLFIVHPLKSGLTASLFATHPPIAERVSRLQNMQIGW